MIRSDKFSCPRRGRRVLYGRLLLSLALVGPAACTRPLQPLADSLGVPASVDEWRLARTKNDREDPEELRHLARRLFDYSAADDLRTQRPAFSGRAGYNGCDQVGHVRFLRGLAAQPSRIQTRVLHEVQKLFDCATDDLVETSHFVVHHALVGEGKEALQPAEKATTLANHLETAWSVLCTSGADADDSAIGRRLRGRWRLPTRASRERPVKTGDKASYFDCPSPKLHVNLCPLPDATYGGTSPDGRIVFNTFEIERAIQQGQDYRILAVAAHELFHKIQYEYGFSTESATDEFDTWFEEGTASWAEAYVVMHAFPDQPPFPDVDFWKHEAISSKPGLRLWSRDYDAMPFFLYMDSPGPSTADDWMLSFLERVRQLNQANDGEGDPRVALRQLELSGPGPGRRYLSFAGRASTHSQTGQNSLDPSRSYRRPYRVRVECDRVPDWKWESHGHMDEMSAAYYEFLGPDGWDVDITVLEWVGGLSRWVQVFPTTPDSDFDPGILCLLQDDLLTVVGSEGFHRPYLIKASCTEG